MSTKQTSAQEAIGAQESEKKAIPAEVLRGLSDAAVARLRRYVESSETPQHRAYGATSNLHNLK